MKFKVGDRIWSKDSHYKGRQSATIIKIDNIKYLRYLIKFDNEVGNRIGDNCAYCRNFNVNIQDSSKRYWQLLPHYIYEYKIKDTKIARKMNQGNIEKEEGGWLWIAPK